VVVVLGSGEDIGEDAVDLEFQEGEASGGGGGEGGEGEEELELIEGEDATSRDTLGDQEVGGGLVGDEPQGDRSPRHADFDHPVELIQVESEDPGDLDGIVARGHDGGSGTGGKWRAWARASRHSRHRQWPSGIGVPQETQ
jgi:hypothetical protein